MEQVVWRVYPCARKGANAGVVELVDTSDSKSDARNSVPVQVRPPVPIILHVMRLLVKSRNAPRGVFAS